MLPIFVPPRDAASEERPLFMGNNPQWLLQLQPEATPKGIQDARTFFWRLRERQALLADSERMRLSSSMVFFFFDLRMIVKRGTFLPHDQYI